MFKYIPMNKWYNWISDYKIIENKKWYKQLYKYISIKKLYEYDIRNICIKIYLNIRIFVTLPCIRTGALSRSKKGNWKIRTEKRRQRRKKQNYDKYDDYQDDAKSNYLSGDIDSIYDPYDVPTVSHDNDTVTTSLATTTTALRGDHRCKIDVFFENFQTALTPPLPVLFWKLHCAFFQKIR